MVPQYSRFLETVILPVVHHCGGERAALADLLLGAALAHQLSPWTAIPPRLGVYGIRPEMHERIWDHYLAFEPELASRTRGLAGQRSFLSDPHGELVHNLAYSTAIAACALIWSGVSGPGSTADESAARWCRIFGNADDHSRLLRAYRTIEKRQARKTPSAVA